MFDPPPGYDDMAGDAEDHPAVGPYRELMVEGVGVVKARKPLPNAIPVLASAVQAKIKKAERQHHMLRFVRTHLADGELERIGEAMLDDDTGSIDPNATQLIAQAIAGWGTPRPT